MDGLKALIGTDVKSVDGGGATGTVVQVDEATKSIKVIWSRPMAGAHGMATRAMSLTEEWMDADTFEVKCVKVG